MSIRTERVARLIQRELASILSNEFSEQIQPMVTVTGVRMTKDLSIAYVHVSVMGQTEAERASGFQHLQTLTPQIRTVLARRIRHQFRSMPDVRFFLDESLEDARRMNDLFERIRAERKRRGEDEARPPEETQEQPGEA
jgi:ribosome-binding factor A